MYLSMPGLDALLIYLLDYMIRMSGLDADGGLVVQDQDLLVTSTDVCLTEGASYQMVMMDSYGDGWNGAFAIVVACDPWLLVNSWVCWKVILSYCGDVVEPGCPHRRLGSYCTGSTIL